MTYAGDQVLAAIHSAEGRTRGSYLGDLVGNFAQQYTPEPLSLTADRYPPDGLLMESASATPRTARSSDPSFPASTDDSLVSYPEATSSTSFVSLPYSPASTLPSPALASDFPQYGWETNPWLSQQDSSTAQMWQYIHAAKPSDTIFASDTLATRMSPDSPQEHNHVTSPPSSRPPKRKRGRPRIHPDPIPPDQADGQTLNSFGLQTAASFSSPDASTINSPSSSRPKAESTSDRESHSAPLSTNQILTELRQRNRAAATRYRNKVQALLDQLEAEEREASLKHQSLVARASELQTEIYDLKNKLLEHSDCDYPPIQRYLRDMTQQVYKTLVTSSQEEYVPVWNKETRPG